ncbi:MAG: sugar phosphate nucleotidyltransferase [Haloferacaceae archaeon]
MSGITDAAVLAAGEGSRLWPLTRYQPKPMLQVGNRTILEYVLTALSNVGIDRTSIVVGHGRERVQNTFEDSFQGMDLSYVHQQSQLGSGHALQQCSSEFDGPFLAVNGDTIVDEVMLEGTIDSYRRTDSAASVAVIASNTPDRYGEVKTRGKRVVEIAEGSGNGRARVNAGVYVFDTDVFDALLRVPFEEGERPLPAVTDELEEPVVATAPGGLWCAPSYPWELLSATEALLLKQENRSAEGAHRDRTPPGDGSRALPSATARERSEPAARPYVGERIHESAQVHETAVIDEHAIVGADCELQPGVVIGRGTCLHANTRVDANSVIDRSIVGPDVRIGANATIRDSIVGGGASIGDGTVSPGRSASIVINRTQYTDRRLGGIVADRAEIGANVSIEPGCRIGANAVVPTGARVSGDVSEGTRVMG